MKRALFASALAVAITAACYDASSPFPPYLTVTPILDSMFVGDLRPPRTVTLYDANNIPHDPGTVTWTITPDTIAAIDAATGVIHGLLKGAAVITAHAAGLAAPALIIVSRKLDLTLLMDIVYLMPGDTFTIPLAIQQKPTVPPTPPAAVWFTVPGNAVDTLVDSVNGIVKALAGGAVPYVAHAATSTASVSDTGMVRVLQLGDTTGGRFYMTVVGTAIRHEGGPARAMNYHRLDDKLAFRLTDSLINADTSLYDKLYVTLPDSVILAPLTITIDSLNPQEATATSGVLNPFCNPPGPWALWSSILPAPGIRAYSHRADERPYAGQLSITQYVAVPSAPGYYAISGRYVFTAQRTDLYYDTLGIVTIRGTFVAPLFTNTSTCQQ